MVLGENATDLITSDSIKGKCEKLNVEPELQVSLLAGMVELSASAAYLSEDIRSARTPSMTLMYSVKTVNEAIMLRKNKSKIDIDALVGQITKATHVVVGIDWGAICLVSCQYDNIGQQDTTEVKRALNVKMNEIKGLIDQQETANVPVQDNETDQNDQFSFSCKADIYVPNKNLPVSFNGAVEFVRSIPNLVKSTNEEKGVPLTYYLMPLEHVAKMCNSKKIQKHYRVIDDGTNNKCIAALEHLMTRKREVHDLNQDVNDYKAFIPEKHINRIRNIQCEVDKQESESRDNIQQLVKEARSMSGEDVSAQVDRFVDDLSMSKYDDDIIKIKEAVRKAINITHLKGIKYLGKSENLFSDRQKKHSIVFYKSNSSEQKDEHNKVQSFFMRLQATHANDDDYEFVVVDKAISLRNWPFQMVKSTIQEYVDGVVKHSDLYSDKGQDLELCLIKLTKTVKAKSASLPPNRAYVELDCPNDQCNDEPVNWKCAKCKELIEINTDNGWFLCHCGKTKPEDAMFRCNGTNHDMDFIKYPMDILNQRLSEHHPIEEINILIMGETGVGKSTWINGFQNYLQFDSLEEAMSSPEFSVLIPSSFTFTQEGGETEIQVGETDDNEEMKAGKSATKEPRSYVFFVNGKRIRLIDTPGIGDSEGIQQDRINVDNILSYLTCIDEIHAVCILLKPNNSRLTVMFRFCIQELLVQLHASAKNNIVFCFTNARATFYQPGDTLPALNKELRDREVGIKATPDRYFCFDSESFRFLACVKNNVYFKKSDIDTYTESWNKSVDETYRLLEHVCNDLKPHRVKETIGMNEARRIIVEMSKPLAEVAKTIDCNLQAAEEARKLISLANSGIESLKKNLKFRGYDIKRIPLPRPRTVCTHGKCIRYVQVGTERIQNTVYEQTCHDACYLQGVPTQTIHNPKLRNCACINSANEKCTHCGHHYSLHMHLTYGTEIFDKEFLSLQVQKEIEEKGDLRSQKEAFKKKIDNDISELKEEELFITKSGAKYGSFLKANAIIPYNDAVGDYIDMSIEQEQMKPSEIKNESLLSKMRQMKREYMKERAMLDKAIETEDGGNIKTPAEVKKLQEELFGLKHFGPTLKRLVDGISITNASRSKVFREKIVAVSPKFTTNTNTKQKTIFGRALEWVAKRAPWK